MPKQSTPNTGPFSVMHMLIFLLIVFLHFYLSSCDFTIDAGKIDPPIPNQTVILDITLEPDTVAVGDTLLIHCIIEDSMDTRFSYFWGLDSSRLVAVNGRKNGPKIKWVASGFEYLEQGESTTTTGRVRVDNGSQDSSSVVEIITIPIKNYESEIP